MESPQAKNAGIDRPCINGKLSRAQTTRDQEFHQTDFVHGDKLFFVDNVEAFDETTEMGSLLEDD